MIRKETNGNANRQTLEEIVRGDEKKQAASGDGGDDDPDPYADKAASDSWQVTTYIYDVTAPYYEVLSETTDGKTTTYDYGVERLAAYSGGSWNAQKTEYVYDGRGSVAQESGYNNSWYTLGGKIGKASVVSKSYSPFGEQLGVAVSGYGFNGEYYDSATGMLNLRARQYEPAQMRFSQRDLMKGDQSIPWSLNRYGYCLNNPIGFTDPSGMWIKTRNQAVSALESAMTAWLSGKGYFTKNPNSKNTDVYHALTRSNAKISQIYKKYLAEMKSHGSLLWDSTVNSIISKMKAALNGAYSCMQTCAIIVFELAPKPPVPAPKAPVSLSDSGTIKDHATQDEQEILTQNSNDAFLKKLIAKHQEKVMSGASHEEIAQHYAEICKEFMEGNEDILLKRNGANATELIQKKEVLQRLDTSKGSELVRWAMTLSGLEYEGKKKITLSSGREKNITIDCSGLVYWSVYQVDPKATADEGGDFGKGSYNQIYDTKNVIWNADKGAIDYNRFKPGDLLYFADAEGAIAHTGIYAGNGQMIDSAGGGVMIREVAEYREWGDGSSTLVQVNRLFED